jgi:hypothetical protein
MASFALLRTASPAPKAARVSIRGPRGLLVWARTRLGRSWLDREIARGTERPASPALALREAQLVSSRERTRLARRLEHVLVDASPLGTLSGVVRVDVGAVEVARPVLTELILSLRSSEAVAARGVVIAWRLLTDATSPVYVPPAGQFSDPDRLWHESLAVLFALRPLTVAAVAGQ